MRVINDKWIVLANENIISKLSLAVSLIDDYTKNQPVGRVNVSIKECYIEAERNPSGYYIFLDLKQGEYSIHVKSDYYYEELIEGVDVSPRANNEKMETFLERTLHNVTLRPKPAYPFPPGVTLIRGNVRDSQNQYAENTKVKIVNTTYETETSEKGEFVIYFPPLKESEIIKDAGKRYVKVNNSKTFRLRATKGIESVEKDFEAEEGITNIIYFNLS